MTGPQSCRWCLFDIAFRDGRWELAWGGSEDPWKCSPGHEHEPITDWDAFWAMQREWKARQAQ